MFKGPLRSGTDQRAGQLVRPRGFGRTRARNRPDPIFAGAGPGSSPRPFLPP